MRGSGNAGWHCPELKGKNAYVGKRWRVQTLVDTWELLVGRHRLATKDHKRRQKIERDSYHLKKARRRATRTPIWPTQKMNIQRKNVGYCETPPFKVMLKKDCHSGWRGAEYRNLLTTKGILISVIHAILTIRISMHKPEKEPLSHHSGFMVATCQEIPVLRPEWQV